LQHSESNGAFLSGTLSLEGKYLTFAIAEEQYGIGILKTREIIGMMKITAIPNAPKFIKGIINLRGKVIPIVDLRRLFSLPEIDDTELACIIVVEIQNNTEALRIGLKVDRVSEVLSIRKDQIEPAPSIESQVNSLNILGIAKTEGSIKILLDIDKILAPTGIDASLDS
jgi:purine-binding chemotaxis protein CheW